MQPISFAGAACRLLYLQAANHAQGQMQMIVQMCKAQSLSPTQICKEMFAGRSLASVPIHFQWSEYKRTEQPDSLAVLFVHFNWLAALKFPRLPVGFDITSFKLPGRSNPVSREITALHHANNSLSTDPKQLASVIGGKQLFRVRFLFQHSEHSLTSLVYVSKPLSALPAPKPSISTNGHLLAERIKKPCNTNFIR